MADRKIDKFRVAVVFNVLNEQYQISILEGMKAKALELGLELVFIQQEVSFNKSGIASLFPLEDYLNADGIILMSSVFAGNDKINTFSGIKNLYGNKPVVTVGKEIPGIPSVMIRTKDSMEHLVAHLVEQHDYNSFLYLSGLADHRDNKNRQKVFVDSMEKYKKEKRPVSYDILFGNFSEVEAIDKMTAYINTHEKAVDAIVCANDNMAVGTYKVLKTLDENNPWRKCAVTGFDDTPQASLSIPPLTTVVQPLDEIGRTSVNLINNLLKGQPVPPVSDIQSKLILRNSCGCRLYSQDTQQIIDTLQHDYFQSEQLLRNMSVFGQEINGSYSMKDLRSTLDRNLNHLGIPTFIIMAFEKKNLAHVMYAKLNGQQLMNEGEIEIATISDFANRISVLTPKGQCFAVKFLYTSEGNLGCIFYDAPSYAHPCVFSLSVNIAQKIYNMNSIRERARQAQRLEQEVEKRTKQLVRANNKRLAVEGEVLKISDMERKRFSTDLHDDICQRLAGISMLCRSYSNNPDGATSEQMTELTQLISTTLSATRQYAHNSFPMDLETLGLSDSIENLLATAAKNTGFTSEFNWHLPKNFDFEKTVAVNIFRITQEGLQNIIKHAKAERVIFRAEQTKSAVVISLLDDGIGIQKDKARSGLGFHSMEYRANQIGAKFSIKANKPKGTTVEIKLPL
ncbi:MAG: substrate-binding domain-containing protein [Treponema sp.]|nr:substrate-binding domain-containing protein [Treponema sp.]